MKNVGIVYDPIYAQHQTGYHPERSERVLYTIKQLTRENMYGDDRKAHFFPISPRLATSQQIAWCHNPFLEQKVEELSENARMIDDTLYVEGNYGDTIASEYTYKAALNAVGGNFEAIDHILSGEVDRAFVLCRPPGHHANTTTARGFCFFNNIALAAEYLLREKGMKKVAILDFDAHAGNGTEEILNLRETTGDVLFFSFHQHPATLYPSTCFSDEIGKGQQTGKTVNLTLLPYSGQQCIEMSFKKLITPMMEEFQPEFILISAGYDSHHADTLTSMGLMEQTYSYIINELGKISERYTKGRMMATLEGGYNLVAIAHSIVDTIGSMANEKPIFQETDLFEESAKILHFTENTLLPELKENLSPYWKCLRN